MRLTQSEARVMSLISQGLGGGAGERDSGSVLTALGCIQIDSISVVRRSHELVLLSRGVPVESAALFTKQRTGLHFEYWAHAAAFVPISLWPLFEHKRRRIRTHGWKGPSVDADACAEVRALVAEKGPVTVSDFGGHNGHGWERESRHKWALEWLWATGELVCVRRDGWKRVYEDPAKVIPAEYRDSDCSEEHQLRSLTRMALRRLGVATTEDIADYFRIHPSKISNAIENDPDVLSVEVDFWPGRAWTYEDLLDSRMVEIPDTVIPLSPFDSLIWYRPRLSRIFGVDYVLEAYKPPAKRQCGYFGMPVLARDQIVGRVALRKAKGGLHVEASQAISTGAEKAVLRAAEQAATWADATLIDSSE